MAETRLTTNELAERLRLTKRQCQNLVEQHALPKHGQRLNAYYLWSEVLPWYLDYRHRQWQAAHQPDAPESSSIAEATLRKERAIAGIKELQLAKQRGQVVAIGDIQAALEQANTVVKQRLLSIAGKLTPRLAATTDKRKIRTHLETEIHAALAELAQTAGNVDLPDAGPDPHCADCRFWNASGRAKEGRCGRPAEEGTAFRLVFNDGLIAGALVTAGTFHCAQFEAREMAVAR